MLDTRKVDVLLQWLACFNIRIRKLSELQDGLQLLKLLSSIEPDCATENVAPADAAFVQIERILVGFHGCLPADFLSSTAAAAKGSWPDGDLAVAAALALSALVLHATRRAATEDVAPLLALNQMAQSFIKDVVQIVNTGDDVLGNLRGYLQAKTEAEASPGISRPRGKRKSASFTFSPSAESPPKPSPLKTPQRRPLMPASQLREMKLLREQIYDEELACTELQSEVCKLKNALRCKDKQIQRLNERLGALQAVSSDDANCLEQLRGHIKRLEEQNEFLHKQVRSMEKVRVDYDDLIRQNATLENEKKQLSKLEEERQALEDKLAAALSDRLDLHAQLSSSEAARTSLESAMAEQAQELESLREFYTSRETRVPFLDSPQTPRTPTERRVSCYQELHLVELEEANARLQGELEEKTANHQAESSALRATIVQLEESKAQLDAEVSRLTQDCSWQSLRIGELENELLESKTLAAQLESRLTVPEGHLDALCQSLVSGNQKIEAIDERSSAACDALNREVLKFNSDLEAALGSSEAAEAIQLDSSHKVVADSSICLDAPSEQGSKLVFADTVVNDLGANLAEGAKGKDSLSPQLSAEDVALLQYELMESRSANSRLSKQLSQVEGEKEAQLNLLAQLRGELVSVGVATEHAQARVKDLEASERQLEVLCSELRLELADGERKLGVALEENSALVKIKEEAQRANAVLRAQLDEATRTHAVVSTSLQEHKDIVARLEEEKERSIQKTKKEEHELKSLYSELSELREKNAALEQQLSRATQSYEERHENFCSEECGRLQRCMEEEATEKDELEGHLLQAIKSLHELEKKCADQAALNECLSSENARMKTDLEMAKLEKENFEANVKELTSKNSILQNSLDVIKRNPEVAAAKKHTVESEPSEKTSACDALEILSATVKLSTLEEREQVIKHADSCQDSPRWACEEELQVNKSQLTEDFKQIDIFKQEVIILREAIMRIDLEKQFLHSSLKTAENTSRSLREACQAADVDARQKLEESRREKEELSCLVEQLREERMRLMTVLSDTKEELSGTKLVLLNARVELSDTQQKLSDMNKELSDASEGLSDTKEELSCCKQELSCARDNSMNLAARIMELEDKTACLQEENGALKVRVDELEVKLMDQLELQRKAEENYQMCVKERDARNESLQRQIDELASGAANRKVCELENQRLRERVRELSDKVDDSRESAASRIRELEEARKHFELDSVERQKKLGEALTKCENLGRTCKILENKNTGLKLELEALRTRARRNMQAASSASMETKIAALETRHKEEIDAWKEKLQNERALRSRREALLTEHAEEITKKVEQYSKDSAAAKTQLSEKTGELATVTLERNKLVAENRSLKAQLSFCDAKLRELPEGKSRKAVNASLYSTPSLESLWSQRPSQTRQSSLASMASEHFRAPSCRASGASLRSGGSSRAGSSANIASSLPNGFSERSLFHRETPEDIFDMSLESLGTGAEDPFSRCSELHRRNSMVPLHLKSCYPVEMQDKRLPPSALTAEVGFALPDISIAADNLGKRSKQGAGSNVGAESSDKRWELPVMVTPVRKNKPKKKAPTPASMKKLFRRTFKK